MNAQVLSQDTYVSEDGYTINRETGEILGIAEPKEEFRITDNQSAEWVLGRMLDIEAKIGAIETSELVRHAKAVLANAESMKKDQARKLDWLHFRFDQDLKAYAQKALEGQKTRTLKTLLGSISLRSNKARLRVVDEEKAIQWAKNEGYCPECVKTVESFLISNIPDVLAEIAAAHPAFDTVPASESMTVKTGVGG